LCRAATAAEKVAIEPPLVSSPPLPSGRPHTTRAIQRITLSSSAAKAGATEARPPKRLTARL
jgi:hypothetical protein